MHTALSGICGRFGSGPVLRPDGSATLACCLHGRKDQDRALTLHITSFRSFAGAVAHRPAGGGRPPRQGRPAAAGAPGPHPPPRVRLLHRHAHRAGQQPPHPAGADAAAAPYGLVWSVGCLLPTLYPAPALAPGRPVSCRLWQLRVTAHSCMRFAATFRLRASLPRSGDGRHLRRGGVARHSAQRHAHGAGAHAGAPLSCASVQTFLTSLHLVIGSLPAGDCTSAMHAGASRCCWRAQSQPLA